MMRSAAIPLLGLTAFVLVGCGQELVLTPAGQKVKVGVYPDPEQCTLLATLKVKAQASVQLLEASADRANKDRDITARNEAGLKGANMIIPIETTADGKGVYELFNCNS